MIKRLLISSVVGLTAMSAQAVQTYHPTGSNLTWGDTAQHQYLLSHQNNPATGATILGWRKGGFGMGIWSSVGIGLDVGPIGKLTAIMDDVNTLQTDMQSLLGGGGAADINLDKVQSIFDFADTVMGTVGEAVDINISAQSAVPLLPIVVTHKKFGSIVVDANLTAKTRMQFLDSPLASNPLVNPITGLTSKFYTNSAVYAKIANVNDINLAYSRQVWKNSKGKLFVGGRASLYYTLVNKTILPATSIADAGSVFSDQYNEASAAGNAWKKGFGLDAGTVWLTDHYRLGATLKNITFPSFEYNKIGIDCERESLSTESRQVCYQAQAFGNEIDLTEKYIMLPQINLEAALYSKSRNWVVAGALETNATSDPVGNAHQWATISGGYASPYVLLPGIRAGLRKNLAGSGLGFWTLGLNWLFISIDAAISFESAELPTEINANGAITPVPPIVQSLARRAAFINLGLEYIW